jgi:hypothetical protein
VPHGGFRLLAEAGEPVVERPGVHGHNVQLRDGGRRGLHRLRDGLIGHRRRDAQLVQVQRHALPPLCGRRGD